MSSGKNPLMLMMALSVPGAAHALGLGDIHVDSGLNERLAAEIDIVGANPLELAGLRAAVASREIFQRYGADRPGFLSSATIKVTQDSQGRPVLAIRSTESFTEPVVNLLVDLTWGHGELVRQYTLLLDPAGFASVPPAPTSTLAATNRLAASNNPVAPNVPAAPAAATPIVETKTQTVARQVDPPVDQSEPKGTEPAVRKTTHIKVGAKATLRGVAWRVGERSEPDLQRMMIAIFRANPTAFDGNINRLHRGAVLTIPSHAEAAAISKAEAKREVHAQMTAWHAPARAAASSAATQVAGGSLHTATAVTASVPTAPVAGAGTRPNAAVSSGAINGSSVTSESQALGRRVQSLEQELTEMKGVLDSERDQLIELRQQDARAGMPVPTVAPQVANTPQVIDAPQAADVPQAIDTPHAQPKPGHTALIPIVAGLGLLSAALATLYVGLRRRVPALKGSRNEVTAAPPGSATDSASESATESTADSSADTTVAVVYAGAVASERKVDALLAGTASQAHGPVQGRGQDGAQTYASDDTQVDEEALAASHEDEATHPMLPIISAGPPAGRSEISTAAASRAAEQEQTVNLQVETSNLRMETTRLDYNLLDLDMTVQHVHMPSALNEHAVVKERRTNLADVLKLAIEREPDRHDLRMKLLELYYSAAATNRKAFLEVVQKFARDRDYLQTEQWDKIAFMGRQIASDNPLFTEESADDDDLANCA
jgi:pilus assembly protein FimV